MRIALSQFRLDPTRGGAEVAALQLIDELVARGHQVDALCCACPAKLPAGARWVALPKPLPVLGWQALRFAQAVERQLRAVPYDISIAAGRGYAEEVVWAQSGAPQARYTLSQLLISPRLWFYAALDRRRFGRVPLPHIIAVSQMVAAEFQHYHKVPAERIHVVNNLAVVDTERFSEQRCRQLRAPARRALGIADDTVALLFVGNDLRRKGLRPLLEALAVARLQWPNLHLLVAGSNEKRQPVYQRLAAASGCGAAVHFLPYQPNPESLYAVADAFCLPSFYDPCALVTIEAMACGLPVITSRTNGAAELITHGQDGLLLESAGDADALAALLFVLRDPARRAAIGGAARAKILAARQQASRQSLAELIEKLPTAARPAPVCLAGA